MNERRRLLKEYIRDDADEELDYLTIIPYTEGESYISNIHISHPFGVSMTDGSFFFSDIWYSVDGGEWVMYSGGVINVPCFSKVRFKGNWHEVMKDVEFIQGNISEFYTPTFYSESSSDWWLLEGTPLSLIHGDNFKERKNDWNYGWDTFYYMFYDNRNIAQINNPKTFLPSTELSEGCYNTMFEGSTIQNAPELPAETLQVGCYVGMFARCYYLEEAPALNAKTLAPYCYYQMFYTCSNLRYAKVTAIDGFDEEMPLESMFYGCASPGLAVLSQEMKSAGFGSGWITISEDYPTNDEGYPEIKGDVTQYDNIVCFNADFKERWFDNQSQNYFNLYESGPNNEGKQLFESFAETMDIGSSIEIGYSTLFFNRQNVFFVAYLKDENTEFLAFYLSSTNPYPDSVMLRPDGSFTIYKISHLIYDYIKK